MLSHLSLSLICVLGLLDTHTHGAEHDTGLVTSGPVVHPHLTGCRSSELVTFRCWWSSGTFSNLSEPGALALFFQMNTIPPSEWQECPEYTPSVQNECYFSRDFTRIWTTYCVQLRSTTHTRNITHDEQCFTVENIVYPDPPVGLNWTLLNISRSGMNFDIMVRWAPPPSAEVQTGWMSLKYEVHYRVRNSSHWDKLDLESGTQQSIYGLHTGKHYEVRVRCTMSAFKNFGDFSDSVFVHVPSILSQESMFPMKLLLIVGVVVLLIFLILVLLSQQQRLMVILLPPVPAPKIKGIDPELLKDNKLSTMSDDGGVGEHEHEFPAHYKVMLDKLNEQRQLDQFTDITLIVDGHQFRAHKAVLAACSQFFHKFFQDFTQEPLVEIEGVSNSAFRHLMEFTYTATLALRGQEEVMDVWRAAEYLQMQEAIKALNNRVKSEERNSTLKSEPQPLSDKTKAKKRKIAETSNVITETLPSAEAEAESERVEIEVEVGEEAIVQECVMEEEVTDGGRETDDSALALLADITSKYQQGAPNVKKAKEEAGDLQEEAVMATKTLEGIEVVEVQISDNMFRCDKCDRCFKLFYHLKQHMKTHTASSEKPFVCKHCGKTYAREGALKQHVTTCHYDAEELNKKLKKKVHMCVYCSKEFDHFGHFKEHLRKHTGEKPFECPDCHERFARNSTLKCHMSACQNGAGAKKGRKKLYECQVCGEVFNSWDQFKDHLVIHTGDKPNHCTLCDQWFTHARDLTAHLQQQHAIHEEDGAMVEERVELEDGVMMEEQVELQDGVMKGQVELQGAVIEGRVELQDGVMVEERVIMEGQMELRDGVMVEGQVVLQDGVMEQQVILQDGVVMEGRVELQDGVLEQPVVLQDGVMIEEQLELQDGVMVEGRVELQDGVMAQPVVLQDGVIVENQVETVLIEVEEDGVKEQTPSVNV